MEKLPRHTRIVKVAWVVCVSAGVWVRGGKYSGWSESKFETPFPALRALCVENFLVLFLEFATISTFICANIAERVFGGLAWNFHLNHLHHFPLPPSSPPLSVPRWRIKFPNYIYDFLPLLLFRYDLPVMLLRQCLRVVEPPYTILLGMNVCSGCICFHFYATFIALFTECAESSPYTSTT